jgi:hypothetical protein
MNAISKFYIWKPDVEFSYGIWPEEEIAQVEPAQQEPAIVDEQDMRIEVI